MENIEMICFQIISSSGAAKSSYIEAMRYARKFDFEKAEELIEDGKKEYLKAHEAHSELIYKETNGEKIDFSLILMHAEDQLMAADNFRLICEENISILKLVKDLK